MTILLDPEPAGLLAELHATHPRDSCPRWAVLGPNYSGKTKFLQSFIEKCTSTPHARSPLPIYLDLKRLPLANEEQMYRSVFRELHSACRSLPFDVSSDGPPDGTGRFDHFINDLLVKAGARVAIVVDHLDSAPLFFARSLMRRFRLMVDQEELHPEFRSLCLLVGGCTSLFDLRQSGDSAFIASNLIFPLHKEMSWSQYMPAGDFSDSAIVKILQHETGGEHHFADLLFSELRGAGPLNAKTINGAIDRLLRKPERHDVFHQIALEIASDLDLRSLVRDLLTTKGGHILRRDSSPDIDRFCLSGVVVLHQEQSYVSYCFRNGILERFCRIMLQKPDNAALCFPATVKLATVRASSAQARDVYSVVKELLSVWGDCVFRVQSPSSTYLHMRYLESDVETWLQLSRRHSLELNPGAVVPASALAAAKSSNEGSERRATFGFDEYTVSYAMPYARSEALLELVICFSSNPVSGLSESVLSHWLRLVEDCWPWLAASALAEASNQFAWRLKHSYTKPVLATSPVSDTRIHWLASDGIIVDAQSNCGFFPFEQTSQQIGRSLDDMNQRSLRLMESGRSSEDFSTELRGIANQVQVFFDNCPSVSHQLQKPNSNFTFISDESGLRIPIELLPNGQSFLSLESRFVRRLRGVSVGANDLPFAINIHKLIESEGVLKVLLVAADPRNSLDNVDKELTHLREQIEVYCQAINLRCEICVLESSKATQSALIGRLQDTKIGPFHIFHFCGHGARGHNPDESSVVLRGARGEEDLVPCEKLRLMLQDRVLWLAYLSCCHGGSVKGSSGIEQQYVGTIHAVLSAGIPTVIGFRSAVSDLGAYMLARGFYEQLFLPGGSFSPSIAIWKARRMVAGDVDKRDAWASSLLISQFG